MDERIKFIGRILDGEKKAVLCREFSISRKTGYKIIKRYNDCGLEALTDRFMTTTADNQQGRAIGAKSLLADKDEAGS